MRNDDYSFNWPSEARERDNLALSKFGWKLFTLAEAEEKMDEVLRKRRFKEETLRLGQIDYDPEVPQNNRKWSVSNLEYLENTYFKENKKFEKEKEAVEKAEAGEETELQAKIEIFPYTIKWNN